jgi:hypothetical protein
LGDTIGAAGYSSWQWHGVSWSPPSGGVPMTVPMASASAVPMAVMSTATSDPSPVFGVSTVGGGSVGSFSYSSWQWHGISRSGSSASTATSYSAVSPVFSNSGDPFVSDNGTASLSGYAYVDTNSNQKMDSSDWAIADATITLTEDGSSTPFASVLSGHDGSYSFAGLAAGKYTLTMVTPTNHPGQDSGQSRAILDASGQLVNLTDTVGQNAYVGIALGDGYTGTNFNFAELTYPGVLISKAMLLGSSPPVIHTNDVVPAIPVPEPNALVLLTVVGLYYSAMGWRRYRKRQT